MKGAASVRLMNPGPETSTIWQMSSSEAAATTCSASSRGWRPRRLARPRAPLAWKSAWSEGRRTGSAPAPTVSKADWGGISSTVFVSSMDHHRARGGTVRPPAAGVQPPGRRSARQVLLGATGLLLGGLLLVLGGALLFERLAGLLRFGGGS